jgi:flavin reductase (DIM6/NTAB) family NADH-FMN oxidoreductase RutF
MFSALPDAVPPETLREALTKLSGPTFVVTCETKEGEAVSLLATSFAAVSFDPPLVTISVARSQANYDALAWAPIWGVNVLGDSQAREARAASVGVDILGTTGVFKGELGETPLVVGSALALECVPYDRHAVGDHVLFVGEVVSVTTGDAPTAT